MKFKNIFSSINSIFLNFFDIGCPIHYLAGISCAGCGMTRAWISLLHFDIDRAFYYHPLFMLPAVFFACLIFKDRISHKIYVGFISVSIVLFIAVYFVRLLNLEITVVEINFKKGLIGRLIMFYF